MPLIESEYRADPTDRTLLGHSSGAYFALHTLFQQPILFQRYVVASVQPLVDEEQYYAEYHDTLFVRLHLVRDVAGSEPGPSDAHVDRFRSFVQTLEGRGYRGFD